MPRHVVALQGALELRGRGEPVRRHAGERAAHGLLDGGGDVACCAKARDRLAQPFGENGLRVGARVRHLARKHLIQDGAECVDVGARVERALTGGLLRTHVARRAYDQPGGGQAVGLVPGSRDTEVRDQGGSVRREQQVFGLDVAMQDAVLMGIFEGAGGFGRDSHGLVQRQLALAIQTRAQRLAFDVGHRVPEDPRGVAGVEDGNDVGVLEAGGELDFAEEPIGAERGCESGTQHLQRDEPTVLEIARQVDGRHAASAEFSLNDVPVHQRGAQGGVEIGHPGKMDRAAGLS